MDRITRYELQVLEMRRDVLVRQLRSAHWDWEARCLMNEELDKVIDQIEKILEVDSATGHSRQQEV